MLLLEINVLVLWGSNDFYTTFVANMYQIICLHLIYWQSARHCILMRDITRWRALGLPITLGEAIQLPFDYFFFSFF